MANAESSSKGIQMQAPHSTLIFDTDGIFEFRIFFKSMHVSYKDQTLENEK